MPPKISLEIEIEPSAKAEPPEMEEEPEGMRCGGPVKKAKGGPVSKPRGSGCAVRGSRACKKY